MVTTSPPKSGTRTPIRLKLEQFATLWEKHGDHPLVSHVPYNSVDQLRARGITDTEPLGCLGNHIFGPPIYIIESGGNIFPCAVDQFALDYEWIGAPKKSGGGKGGGVNKKNEEGGK